MDIDMDIDMDTDMNSDMDPDMDCRTGGGGGGNVILYILYNASVGSKNFFVQNASSASDPSALFSMKSRSLSHSLIVFRSTKFSLIFHSSYISQKDMCSPSILKLPIPGEQLQLLFRFPTFIVLRKQFRNMSHLPRNNLTFAMKNYVWTLL